MGLFEQFPYQNFHELNLDWLIQQINLVKESVVLSVNGQTGEVILYPEAFVRLPDLSDTTTWSFFRYVDGKAEGVQFINGQPMQRIDDLNRYNIYDSGNPPPYPVTAVNGQTGDVVIEVPVQSVNGMTGNIILYQNASIEFPAINTDSWEMWRETDTNQALGIKFNAGQPMKRVDNGLEYTVYDSQNQPPYPVNSVAGLTGAVAILNTQIVTDQGQQKIKIVFPVDSVDGQTGSVNTWAYTNNDTTKLPLAAPADLWNLTRDLNSGTVGLRFTYDSVNGSQAYLTFNDGVNPETALRLLTPADIPSSSGVVSINGMAGVVSLYADQIMLSNNDNTLISQALANIENNLSLLDSAVNVTNNILIDALTANKTTMFRGSGAAYTGNVPHPNYYYATFIVNVNASIRTVIAHAPRNTIAINTYDNGAWLGWKEIATDTISAQSLSAITSAHTIEQNDSSIYTFGRLVQLKLSINLISNVSAYGEIASLSSELWPVAQSLGSAIINNQEVPFDITASGKIRIWQPETANTTISLEIIYLI